MNKLIGCGFSILLSLSVNALAQDLSEAPATSVPKTEMPRSLETQAKKEKYTDWVLNCAEGNCIIHQYILDDQKRVISSVSLHRKNGKVLVTYTVPLMTNLRRGAEVKINRYDQKMIYNKKYQYSFCSRIGCMITYQEDSALIEAMKKGRTFNLSFSTLEGKVIRSVHSLFGFGDAYIAFLEKTKNQ